MPKKSQKLTLLLASTTRDYFGVHEVEVLINGKSYTYPLSSESAVEEVEGLIRKKKFGKALQLLKKSVITGFNSFGKEKM